MATTLLHRADSRGYANHGWLDTHHTFSFGSYFDHGRIRFGVLRVLNDDVVSGGMGFDTHPHENMEIISIPLDGDLEHKDSMGNTTVIRSNDVQIMSAGTGIYHSEYNHNENKPVNFLQLWIFPKEKNIQPRYGQKTFLPENRINRFQLIVSPEPDDHAIRINQDAWLYLGSLKNQYSGNYKINKKGNGIYFFIIEGKVTINGQDLGKRDGMGVTETDQVKISAHEDSEVLCIEVPMN